MPSSQRLELFILGAGCSVDFGYPTARGMLATLATFGESLGPNTERIRGCVDRTVSLMRTLRVQTIDELAHRLHHGRADPPDLPSTEKPRFRVNCMNEAKIAVSAFFQHLEHGAATSGLPSYHNFLHRLFPSDSGRHYQDQLVRSTGRVLTFNYDRLLEIAFCQHFSVDWNWAFYGTGNLNSGINAFHNDPLTFEDNRFSFLKMHGSVGMFVDDDLLGETQIFYQNPNPNGEIELKDEHFFVRNPDNSLSSKPRWTLIFFPHEKQYLLGERTAFPYRKYAEQVWQRAEEIASHATEIWLIGYSVCETDFPYTMKLLRAAASCGKIVIQGTHPQPIYDKLRVRAPDLQSKLECFEERF